MFPSPIGELHFSIRNASFVGDKCLCVSVPYRGATFLNHTKPARISPAWTFPSPIGELHFSILRLFLRNNSRVPVSVPYRGATFLNKRWFTAWIVTAAAVSVPYRGATFLNKREGLYREGVATVSVPYRGATFLNSTSALYASDETLFPSPIGELHFSISLRTSLILSPMFPSPIGELHFSIPSPQPHVLSGTNRGIAGEK